jgi:hypothetical protein
MNDDEFLTHLESSARKELKYFSNSNKEERERWTVSEFLSIICVDYQIEELISPEQRSKVDVHFRNARFQVKELTDPNMRRGKFYKDAYNSLKAASSLDEVSLVGDVHDTPPVTKMYDLVLDEAKKLADDDRYKELKGQLDLLIYVTRPRAALVQESEIIIEDFSCLGWRSVLCMNSTQSVVLFSSHKGPDFLSNKLGKVMSNNG